MLEAWKYVNSFAFSKSGGRYQFSHLRTEPRTKVDYAKCEKARTVSIHLTSMTGTKVPKAASVSTRLVPMNVSDISFFTGRFHPLHLIRNDWEGQFFGWRFVAALLPYLIFDLLKTNINIVLELVLAQV